MTFDWIVYYMEWVVFFMFWGLVLSSAVDIFRKTTTKAKEK